MHELAICQSLMDQVNDIALQRHSTCVTSIILGIGPLSGVEAELLRNAYPFASAGSVAEHAELIIETLTIRVKCDSCGTESEAKPNKLICKQCGDWHTTLVSGDELLLMSVELETAVDLEKEAIH